MDYLFDPKLCSALVYYLISYLYARPHHGLRERALMGALALLLGTLAACESDHIKYLHPIHGAPAPMVQPTGDIGLLAGPDGQPSVFMGSGFAAGPRPGMTAGGDAREPSSREIV